MQVFSDYCRDWCIDAAVFQMKKDILKVILNAPTSFFDTTPKDVIMKRYNDDVQHLWWLINDWLEMSRECMYCGLTMYYVFTMNPALMLGMIPFCYFGHTMMSRSSKTIKALLRCLDKFDNLSRINRQETVNGGVSIRAFEAQAYSEQVNVINQDNHYLCQMINFGCFHSMCMTTRKASLVLVALGCANALLAKTKDDYDIILTTLLLQRLVDLGYTIVAIMFRYSW